MMFRTWYHRRVLLLLRVPRKRPTVLKRSRASDEKCGVGRDGDRITRGTTERCSPRRTHWLSTRVKHGRGRHATADKCSTGLLHLHLDSEGESDRRWWRVALHWLCYQGQPATVAKRVGIQPVMGPPGGVAVLEAEIRKEERQGLSGSV